MTTDVHGIPVYSYYDGPNGRLSWHEARYFCARNGGTLARIDINPQTDFSLPIEHDEYWVGFHRNKWVWESGKLNMPHDFGKRVESVWTNKEIEPSRVNEMPLNH